MSRRRWLAVALAAIALPALGACGRPSVAPANVYESRAAGFRLALPESWIGRYHVLEATGRTAGIRRPKALHLVQFAYLPSDTTRAAQRLLEITVFESADWIALDGQPGASPGQVVATREGRVWVASLPAPDPAAAGADSSQYAAMLLDLETLKRTFSLR